MTIKPIGQRYVDFLRTFEATSSMQEIEALFSPTVKKMVNSNIVSHNRDELVKQMRDVINNYGAVSSTINLLELIVGKNENINVIRFQILYKDNSTECVISIITCDDKGMIQEINEVFGDKKAYVFSAS